MINPWTDLWCRMWGNRVGPSRRSISVANASMRTTRSFFSPACYSSLTGTMTNNTYVDYVLAEDDRMASLPEPSKSPFVAVGSRMWAIWQTVLRFRHGYHRQPTATSLMQALMDSSFGTSSLSYDTAPINYPKNMRCKLFVVDVRFVS